VLKTAYMSPMRRWVALATVAFASLPCAFCLYEFEPEVLGDLASGAPSMPPPPAVTTCPCIGSTSSFFNGTVRPAGWGATCAAWNEDSQGLGYVTGSCSVTDPPDWCADMWCYVDSSCTGAATYESNVAVAKWSYKACDAEFAGNTYVGFCECTGVMPDIFGPSGIVPQRPYGWGASCAAWNENAQVGLGHTTSWCNVSSPPDWCVDDWCYVVESKCSPMEPKSTSFGAGAYPWSYATCDKNFGGNTYVGFPPGTPAPPSPPPLPFPPPPTDGNVYSVVSFKASGDVSDFNSAVQDSIAAAFATKLSVEPSMIVVEVTSGSVAITVTIESSSEADAKNKTSILSSTLTSGPATTSFLSTNGVVGVTVTSKPAVSTTVAGSGGGGLSAGAIASIVVPICLLFIAIMAFAYIKISKDKQAEKLIKEIQVEGGGDMQLEYSGKPGTSAGNAGYSEVEAPYKDPTNAAAV